MASVRRVRVISGQNNPLRLPGLWMSPDGAVLIYRSTVRRLDDGTERSWRLMSMTPEAEQLLSAYNLHGQAFRTRRDAAEAWALLTQPDDSAS